MLYNDISYPLISCVCITHKKREALQRAIKCFQSQTYPNKELFILYESQDEVSEDTLRPYTSEPDITIYVEPSHPKKTLGQLRNTAIHNCKGEFFCQWDDDDWYSSYRVEEMYKAISLRKPSCVLSRWIIYNSITSEAYLSPFYHWEGSILAKKDLLSTTGQYAPISRGEDTVFVEQLIAKELLSTVDLPHLYIYTFDGDNTWDTSHWKTIFKSSQKLPKEFAVEIAYIRDGHYSPLVGSNALRQICTTLQHPR